MREREKQGDTWYSHSVTDPTSGEVLYCKGRPGKDSPGWLVDATTPEPAATATPNNQAAPNTPTAYWQIASTLITAGKITQDQAGEIAKGPGNWTEKAARLAAA